jgi:hypothetical protein
MPLQRYQDTLNLLNQRKENYLNKQQGRKSQEYTPPPPDSNSKHARGHLPEDIYRSTECDHKIQEANEHGRCNETSICRPPGCSVLAVKLCRGNSDTKSPRPMTSELYFCDKFVCRTNGYACPRNAGSVKPEQNLHWTLSSMHREAVALRLSYDVVSTTRVMSCMVSREVIVVYLNVTSRNLLKKTEKTHEINVAIAVIDHPHQSLTCFSSVPSA